MISVPQDTTDVKAVEKLDLTPPVEENEPRKTFEELQQLPATATPAQTDSVIRQGFQPKAAPLSAEADSLEALRKSEADSLRKINLPKYYREHFFSKSDMLHPELNGARYGVPGDPIPYVVSNDHIITSLLLLCFVFSLFAYSKSRRFVARQAKSFFYIQKGITTEIPETANELRFQFFFVVQTSLLFAIIAYFYIRYNVAETFSLSSNHLLILIFFGILATYFGLKALLAWFVNWVFFNSRANAFWQKSTLFLNSIEGLLLFPMVMVMAYFGISSHTVNLYTLGVVILVKFLLLYRCYVIFFKKIGAFLQIILYFCALEIIPLLMLFGTLSMMVNYLKINL